LGCSLSKASRVRSIASLLRRSVRSHIKQKHELTGDSLAAAPPKPPQRAKRSKAAADEHDDGGGDDDDDEYEDDLDNNASTTPSSSSSSTLLRSDLVDLPPPLPSSAAPLLEDEIVPRDAEPVSLVCSMASCQRKFTAGALLKRHLRQDHSLTVVSCYEPLCTFFATSEPELRRHIRATHLVSIYECPLPGCSKQYPWATPAQLHVSTRHRGDRLPCGLCDAAFERYGDFLTHRVLTHQSYAPPVAVVAAADNGDDVNVDEADDDVQRPRFSQPKRARVASTLSQQRHH
jgi:hypothetical protein